jgi:molybdopterin converting factor subunit 1
MRLKVRFFASHREVMGAEAVSLELPEGSTVQALFDRLARDRPKLKGLEEHTLAAVNQDQVGWDRKLNDGDEVAFYPPVGGG